MIDNIPGHADLFLTTVSVEKAAQRATKQRRSKPPSPATDLTLPSPLPPSGSIGQDDTRVIRFPVTVWAPRLWRGKVDEVARILSERKTDQGRQNFWRNQVETLSRKMRRRSATDEEVEKQIDDFYVAVSWALNDQQSGPGAA